MLFPSLSCSCFLSIPLQERVCGGTTTPQEQFCGASSPTKMILWSVITHKNDFCERQPCPTRTTNSWTTDFFTNSHIILPSVWFVCLLQCLSGTSEGRYREHSRRWPGQAQADQARIARPPPRQATLIKMKSWVLFWVFIPIFRGGILFIMERVEYCFGFSPYV